MNILSKIHGIKFTGKELSEEPFSLHIKGKFKNVFEFRVVKNYVELWDITTNTPSISFIKKEDNDRLMQNFRDLFQQYFDKLLSKT